MFNGALVAFEGTISFFIVVLISSFGLWKIGSKVNNSLIQSITRGSAKFLSNFLPQKILKDLYDL